MVQVKFALKRRKWWAIALVTLFLVVATFVFGGGTYEQEIAPGVLAKINWNPRMTTVTVTNTRTTAIEVQPPNEFSNFRVDLTATQRVVIDGAFIIGNKQAVPPGSSRSWTFGTYDQLDEYKPIWPWVYRSRVYWDANINKQPEVYEPVRTHQGLMWVW